MTKLNGEVLQNLEIADLIKVYKKAIKDLHSEETKTYNEFIVKEVIMYGTSNNSISEDSFGKAHDFFMQLDNDLQESEKEHLIEVQDNTLREVAVKGLYVLDAIYRLDLSIPVVIAYIRFCNPESGIYLEFVRDKWEYRGDYEFMDPDYENETDLHKWLYFFFSEDAPEGEVGWKNKNDFTPNFKWKKEKKASHNIAQTIEHIKEPISFKDKNFVVFVDYYLRDSVPASIIRRGGQVKTQVSGKTDYIVYDKYGANKVPGNSKAKAIELDDFYEMVKSVPIEEPTKDYAKNLFDPCEGQDLNEYCLTYGNNIELYISMTFKHLAAVRSLIAAAIFSDLGSKYKSIIISELCSYFFIEYLAKECRPSGLSKSIEGLPNIYGEGKEANGWHYRDLMKHARHLAITDPYVYETYLKDVPAYKKTIEDIKGYSYDLSLAIDKLISIDGLKNADNISTEMINSYLCKASGVTMEQLCALQFGAHHYTTTDEFVFYENNINELILLRYVGTNKNVKIPKEIDGKLVTAVFSYAFANRRFVDPDRIVGTTYDFVMHYNNKETDMDAIQSIEVPDTVREIGEYAFENLQGLETINIPEKVNIIPSLAGCKALNYIKLPKHVFSIRQKPFYGCDSLKEITLPLEVSKKRKLFSENMTVEVKYYSH